MTNRAELRRLAHEASEDEMGWLDAERLKRMMVDEWADFVAEATPNAVLSLLDELDAKDNTLLALTTRHFAESWSRRSTDAKLDEYLSAGIAQLQEERDAALAELEALRQEKTDWQKECLKKGFEYVRESDDHYVVADPAEMVSLLRDLLGIDVRQKNGIDYGVSVAQLEEQIEGLVNIIHGLEVCRKDAERYRWLRDGESSKFLSFYACGFPGDELDASIDAAMSQEANHA